MSAAANMSKPSNLPFSSTVLASATITRTLFHPFFSILFLALIAISGLISTPNTSPEGPTAASRREASSGSAPCIENTIPRRELKKVHRSLPQRLYEKDVKIWKGSDQTNQVSGIRRGEFAIVHRVYFFVRFISLCSSSFNNRVYAKKLSR